jgi:hypothetical protein
MLAFRDECVLVKEGKIACASFFPQWNGVIEYAHVLV